MRRIEEKLIPALLVSLIFTLVLCSVGASAEGTSITIEDVALVRGETGELPVVLSRAPAGLRVLEAKLEIENPDIANFGVIKSKAVSKQFLKIDKQEPKEIIFRMVDLKNKVGKGAKAVALASVEVKGVSPGKTDVSLTVNNYMDEGSNHLSLPTVSSKISIKKESEEAKEKAKQTKEEPTKQDKKETSKKEDTQEEKQEAKQSEQEAAKEKSKKDEKKREAAKEEEKTTEEKQQTKEQQKEEDYQYKLIGHKVGVTESSYVELTVKSIPNGLQYGEVSIAASENLTLGELWVVRPQHYRVEKRETGNVSYQFADFSQELKPGEEDITLAMIKVSPTRIGKARVDGNITFATNKGGVIEKEFQPAGIVVLPPIIGNSEAPPNDLNGDGLYEDVNGDGKLTVQDAYTLTFNLNSEPVRKSSSVFDFDKDGSVNFADARVLFQKVKKTTQ